MQTYARDVGHRFRGAVLSSEAWCVKGAMSAGSLVWRLYRFLLSSYTTVCIGFSLALVYFGKPDKFLCCCRVILKAYCIIICFVRDTVLLASTPRLVSTG